MTRFLLSLEDAVSLIFAAVQDAEPGETWVPRAPSSLVVNIARALIGERNIQIVFTGIRPGEKVHEIMVSEEEIYRTVERGKYFVILPMLPEVSGDRSFTPARTSEYSSAENVMTLGETVALLRERRLMVEDVNPQEVETLR
jgi:UDP-glucose 4-epimerase